MKFYGTSIGKKTVQAVEAPSPPGLLTTFCEDALQPFLPVGQDLAPHSSP